MADEHDKSKKEQQSAQDSRSPGLQQEANSKQSARGQQGQQGNRDSQQGGGKASGERSRSGIGSSQGQDRGSPDISRAQRGGQSTGSEESIVQDPTGAFKERP